MGKHGPYFFFSYAHTPSLPDDKGDPDAWILKLYNDLRREVLHITSVSPDNLGFIDRNMGAGRKWSPEIAKALATCRVFVALYSPRYFASEYCGKEWAVFARRLADHQVKRGESVPAIVPVLWTEGADQNMPQVAQALQIDRLNSHAYWSTGGFYYIIKRRKYRDAYRGAVSRLAKIIKQVAEGTPPDTADPVECSALPSIFGPVGESGVKVHRPIHITVATLCNAKALPDGRSSDYYGPTWRDWNPYRPDSMGPIAEYAAALAECAGYQPQVGSIEEHFPEYLSAGEPVAPGMLLVDPWASLDEPTSQLMRKVDAADRPWVRPVVPWSEADPETSMAHQRLREGLTAVLGRSLSGMPVNLRQAAEGIPTVQLFGDTAGKVALAAGAEYLRRVSPDAVDDAGIERPRLDLPGADDIGDVS